MQFFKNERNSAPWDGTSNTNSTILTANVVFSILIYFAKAVESHGTLLRISQVDKGISSTVYTELFQSIFRPLFSLIFSIEL